MNSRSDKMNSVVLVTGASRGLGVSIAKVFLENKDIVYVNYFRSRNKAEELGKKYELAIPIYCDVSNEQEVKEMIEQIKKEQGHLDIIVNNAGIAKDSLVEDKTKESFTTVLQTLFSVQIWKKNNEKGEYH